MTTTNLMTESPLARVGASVSAASAASILDSLSQHVAVLDRDGVIVGVNRAWDRFAVENGATMQRVGCFVGTSYLEACRDDAQRPDESAATVACGVRAVLSGARPSFTQEYPCHSPTESRWFRLTVTPLHGGEGAVCIHENITEAWLAREEARKTVQSLTVIGDHVPGMLGYWDRELRCRFANAAYLEWFGRSKDGMIGVRIQDLQGEELFRKNEPFLRAALRGETQSFERQITKPNGETGHLWARYVPDIVDGAVRGLFAVVLDITDRVRAEGAGRFASAIMENMAEGLQLTRLLDQTIVYANPTFERMFGYDAGTLAGNPVSVLNAQGERTPQEVADDIVWSLHETGSWRGELRSRRRDGSLFWTAANVSTFHHPEHGAVWLTVQQDITERKEKEDALRSSLREKESLLKEVHHRVKNNLQVINSLLRLEARRADEPAARDVLGEMQNRIRSMALLHESLYRTGHFSAVDLADYLRRLTSQLLRAQGARATTVHMALALESCAVSIDQAVPCALILNELVTNSLKHAFGDRPRGEIRVRLEPRPDGGMCLSVGDDGRGLPPDFEVGKTNSLGLQLVSDLAMQLGGRLDIETGSPTRFAVTFVPQPVDPRIETSPTA